MLGLYAGGNLRFDFYLENQSGSSSFLFTPPTYWTRGLGGAEAGLVGLTETLVKFGHEVHVWNTPLEGEGIYDGVEYHDVSNFDLFAPYDIFVCFRNPFVELPYIQANKKLWWSTDQLTTLDYGLDIKPFVSHSIVISEFHRQYHINTYGFDPAKITAIDLGVRTQDYDRAVPKVKNRLLYSSVPSRGLEYLADIFPRIRYEFPDAELYVSSDFSIWGHGVGAHNQEYKDMFSGMDGVHFLGKVPRSELIDLQLSSDLLVYPNAPSNKAHAELFSVSLAEAQVAGAIPITSYFGGLQTTVIRPEGFFVKDYDDETMHPDNPRYSDKFVYAVNVMLQDRVQLNDTQKSLATKARMRFNWNTVTNQWLDVIAGLSQ